MDCKQSISFLQLSVPPFSYITCIFTYNIFNKGVLSVKRNRKLVICLATPLAVGAASAFITRSSMSIFRQLKKPPLSPPGWIFPVVWTILFVFMGIASYLVITANEAQGRAKALLAYAGQLAVNFFWPIFFFKQKWFLFSFIWLVALWCLVFVTIKYFYFISRKAACLLIPYIMWITYAGYLNLLIALLN